MDNPFGCQMTNRRVTKKIATAMSKIPIPHLLYVINMESTFHHTLSNREIGNIKLTKKLFSQCENSFLGKLYSVSQSHGHCVILFVIAGDCLVLTMPNVHGVEDPREDNRDDQIRDERPDCRIGGENKTAKVKRED